MAISSPPPNGLPLKKTTSSPAVSAVFSTTELVEAVLEYLPILDLIRCKAVNRKFNDVVTQTKSKVIKQRLFLLPVSESSPVSMNVNIKTWEDSLGREAKLLGAPRDSMVHTSA
ncbi:uncharacterized protein LTR77_005861 [Saxophila tyrrhenica]|uniref:F-box domain-containing protein n=1 Tax=Saxophila tyrrhenica TaxID=1690608 RepID=A0AAV9P9Q7_9PEZI|nr:hypothetical protein LTR77_005861 [Saxophila tyrrhenica]